MEQAKIISEMIPTLLAIGGALLTLIIWLVRLEGRVNYCEKMIIACQKDVAELRVKHESLDSKVVEQLSQVRESLARIEGALGVERSHHGA